MENLFFASLVLFASALVAGIVFHRIKLPTILGYILVGIALGSSFADLLGDGPMLEFVAEAGVLLLLFMVGLEFSLTEFWSDHRKILVAGGLQGGVVGSAVGLGVWMIGWGVAPAILLGASAAMSSTALTAKQLADQGEITTRHGRSAISVLIFQDLAAIPLLALLAVWQMGGEPSFIDIAGEVGKVIALFAAALLLARPILHHGLLFIYRNGNAEVLVLAALTIVALSAEAAHLAGASAALGAFLAGLLLGESDVRHRIEEDLRPFRDVFASVFFVSIGLQLDVSQVMSAPTSVLVWIAILVPAKFTLNFVALRLSGSSSRDALQTGLILAHGGEFGLLLVSGALSAAVLPAEIGQPFLVALVISMGLGPLLIRANEQIASRLASLLPKQKGIEQEEERRAAQQAQAMKGHLIICGAGPIGRTVARAGVLAQLPLVLIEPDLATFRSAKKMGLPVVLGDPNRLATLEAARAQYSDMLVMTDPNPSNFRRVIDWYLSQNAGGRVVAYGTREFDNGTPPQDDRVCFFDPDTDIGIEFVSLVFKLKSLSDELADDILHRLRAEILDPVRRRAP